MIPRHLGELRVRVQTGRLFHLSLCRTGARCAHTRRAPATRATAYRFRVTEAIAGLLSLVAYRDAIGATTTAARCACTSPTARSTSRPGATAVSASASGLEHRGCCRYLRERPSIAAVVSAERR